MIRDELLVAGISITVVLLAGAVVYTVGRYLDRRAS